MGGTPDIANIDLEEEKSTNRKIEERKRAVSRFSNLSEQVQVRIQYHALADSPTIKNSLTDWIATFRNLPRYPANISEFITSGSLYFIMEEIEPEYFKEFPNKTINKQEARTQQDRKTLQKVYKHMLSQMELWFSANQESRLGQRTFTA